MSKHTCIRDCTVNTPTEGLFTFKEGETYERTSHDIDTHTSIMLTSFGSEVVFCEEDFGEFFLYDEEPILNDNQ